MINPFARNNSKLEIPSIPENQKLSQNDQNMINAVDPAHNLSDRDRLQALAEIKEAEKIVNGIDHPETLSPAEAKELKKVENAAFRQNLFHHLLHDTIGVYGSIGALTGLAVQAISSLNNNNPLDISKLLSASVKGAGLGIGISLSKDAFDTITND